MPRRAEAGHITAWSDPQADTLRQALVGLSIDAFPGNPDAHGYWSVNAAVSNFSVSAAPEPASYALMAAGLFVLGRRRRRA